MKKKYLLIANLIIFLLLISTPVFAASTIFITDNLTTTNYINTTTTTATVDTTAAEIRLPYQMKPNAIDLKNDSTDYVVMNGSNLETYSFNGTSMSLNTTLSVNGITNPIGVTSQINSTDMVVLDGTSATRYMFNGTQLSSNPLLSVTGLTAPVSVSSRPTSDDIAVLNQNSVSYYNFSGAGMVNNASLSITTGLTNPIAVSLHPSTYDTVVLDGDKTVKFFKYTGASLAEAPALRITGLVNPVSVTVKDNDDIIVLDAGDKSVKYFSFDGTGYTQNTVLSLTGLTDPVAISAKQGSYDYAVVDNGAVKYYSFNGSAMTYNSALSVGGITVAKTYKTSALAQSVFVASGSAVSILRLSANQTLPAGTSITYEVTANGGTNWTPVSLNTATTIANPGTSVGWRATLTTTDITQTPTIKPNIQLMTGNPPQAQNLTVTPKNAQGYVTSVMPTLGWTFNDPDAGDTQSAYQVQIYRVDTGAMIYDTGKVLSSSASIQVPSGILSGTDTFWWRVMVWDNWDLPSAWTTNLAPNAQFTVLAIYDYSVTSIVNPPTAPPNPPLPTMTFPVYIKAGSNFSFRVSSLGIINQVQAVFSFGKTVNMTPTNPAGSKTNTWNGTTFPAGTLPTDTTISVTLTGTKTADGSTTVLTVLNFAIIKGSVYGDYLVVLTK